MKSLAPLAAPLVATAFKPAGMKRKKLLPVTGSPASPLLLAPLDQVKFVPLPELFDQLTGAAPATATTNIEPRTRIPRLIESIYNTVLLPLIPAKHKRAGLMNVHRI